MADLQRKADTLFSKFIRKRDCGDKTGKCCSCGAIITFEVADASHFVSRQYLATRYNERNVHASCRKCNRFLEGRKEEYALFLVRKYGIEILEELNRDKHKPYWKFPYEEIIEKYGK